MGYEAMLGGADVDSGESGEIAFKYVVQAGDQPMMALQFSGMDGDKAMEANLSIKKVEDTRAEVTMQLTADGAEAQSWSGHFILEGQTCEVE